MVMVKKVNVAIKLAPQQQQLVHLDETKAHMLLGTSCNDDDRVAQ
jgi:hypothetical protein